MNFWTGFGLGMFAMFCLIGFFFWLVSDKSNNYIPSLDDAPLSVRDTNLSYLEKRTIEQTEGRLQSVINSLDDKTSELFVLHEKVRNLRKELYDVYVSEEYKENRNWNKYYLRPAMQCREEDLNRQIKELNNKIRMKQGGY